MMEEISTYDHSDFFIEITVSEPQKMGEGIGSHLVYKYVSTIANPITMAPATMMDAIFSIGEILVIRYSCRALLCHCNFTMN